MRDFKTAYKPDIQLDTGGNYVQYSNIQSCTCILVMSYPYFSYHALV